MSFIYHFLRFIAPDIPKETEKTEHTQKNNNNGRMCESLFILRGWQWRGWFITKIASSVNQTALFSEAWKAFFLDKCTWMRLKEKIVCTVMFEEFVVRGIVHRIISWLWKISKDTRNTLENHINTKPSSADKCACLSSSSRLNIRDQASMIPMRWRPTPIEIIEWLPDSENV